MRNYFERWPVKSDWDDHLERGSLGGIDRAMPVGTTLPACAPGIVTFTPNNGTGGHTATITHDDGTKTQYMHLSAFTGLSGRRVKEGDVVGKSGGERGTPGAGTSTGPHLHSHSITKDGTRVPPFYEEDHTMPTVAEIVAAVWARPVSRNGKKIPAIQELADAKTLGLQNAAAIEQLQKQVAAIPGVGPLPDSEIERIAEAVVDEQAERLAE